MSSFEEIIMATKTKKSNSTKKKKPITKKATKKTKPVVKKAKAAPKKKAKTLVCFQHQTKNLSFTLIATLIVVNRKNMQPYQNRKRP